MNELSLLGGSAELNKPSVATNWLLLSVPGSNDRRSAGMVCYAREALRPLP